MRKVCAAACGVKAWVAARPPNSSCAPCSTWAAAGSSDSATAVGAMPAPARTSSGSPIRPRRRFSWPDTAGWLVDSRKAARDTLRSVITVWKARMRERSILSKATPDIIPGIL